MHTFIALPLTPRCACRQNVFKFIQLAKFLVHTALSYFHSLVCPCTHIFIEQQHKKKCMQESFFKILDSAIQLDITEAYAEEKNSCR